MIIGGERVLSFKRSSDLYQGGLMLLRYRLICRKWNETVVRALEICINKDYFKNNEGIDSLSPEIVPLRETLNG